jgi:hypothetical protein
VSYVPAKRSWDSRPGLEDGPFQENPSGKNHVKGAAPPPKVNLSHHLHLYPTFAGGKAGYLYNVTLDGDLIVERSRDPETDAARALIARGITGTGGMVEMRDGKTNRVRSVINVERAAKLRCAEENRDGLRFRKYRENPDSEGYSPEEPEVAPTLPPDAMEAA